MGKGRTQRVFNVGSDFGCRTARLYVRITSSVKKRLKEVWKTRKYPDPKDPKKSLSFKSESEYLEFVIRALNKAGKGSWYTFSHILNPDYPGE
jgi:hypothetical protein